MLLLDTTIEVHYRFLNLHSRSAGGASDPGDGRRGQVNGLCGAAVPGELSMVTGTHTGPVHVMVELHDAEPPLDDVWEEVVEVSFATAADDLVLSAFQDTTELLDVPPGSYQVRYCARGMAEAADADAGDEPIDHYLLQLWPSTDRVVRRTTEFAAYWHGDNGPAPSIADRVAALREARVADPEAGEVWDVDGWADDASVVEGFDPTMMLPEHDARSPVDRLVERDPGLVAALAGAGDEVRRSVAVWAAEDAMRVAGLHGEPWSQLLSDAATGRSEVGALMFSVAVDGDGSVMQAALDALSHAGDPGTLTAACGALLRPDEGDDVTQRVRRVFPGLLLPASPGGGADRRRE